MENNLIVKLLKTNINQNVNIKTLPDSIVKRLRIREFNQFITNGNARIYSFPGAASKQLLHYMDVNLEIDIDTIILHICVNDILQDSTPDNAIDHMML